jgi:hypothetical protein
MMTFPVSITGNALLPKEASDLRTVEDVCARIESMLESAQARTITRQDGSVIFTGGLFRTVTGWNILVAISYGEIAVENTKFGMRISYFASTVEMLILTTLMLGFLAASSISHDTKGIGLPSQHPFWFVVLGWFFLFGGNYILAALRFPRWLEHGLGQTS